MQQFKSKEKQSFLPHEVASLFKKVLLKLTGILSITLGVLLFINIASYSQFDPSGNTVGSTGSPTNLLGSQGAYIADIFIQYFGYSAYFIVFFTLYAGLKIIKNETEKLNYYRCTLAVINVILIAASIGMLSNSSGGIIGYAINQNLRSLGSTAYIMISSVFIALMLLLTKYTLEINWQKIKSIMETIKNSVIILDYYIGRLFGKHKKIKGASGKTNNYNSDVRITFADIIEKRKKEKKPNVETNRIKDRTSQRVTKEKSPNLPFDNKDYELPPLNLLEDPRKQTNTIDKDSIIQNAKLLEGYLQEFGVEGKVANIKPGPVVTLYEFEPAAGIKTSKVVNLEDDIARSMSALSVRIALIPGRNVIGIELPNIKRQTVYIKELLTSEKFNESEAALNLCLGKNIGGESVFVNLAKMPHLLVAGTTGSGKSVAVNAMILSLLFRLKPKDCRFIMIDPKMLELSVYNDIPHLLTPVVINPQKAVVALKWAVREMEERYRLMSTVGVRNLDGYNAKIKEYIKKGKKIKRKVNEGIDPNTGKMKQVMKEKEPEILPYIVIIVDEMADLMLVAGKEVEASIQRLAQMARAAGIHLIMATQRPSVDVITGTIKANFPTRISFQVTSKIDSRTIIGEQGAEQLLGKGDMLYQPSGKRPVRLHAPFVSDNEVERVVQFLKAQGEPEYVEGITDEENNDQQKSVLDIALGDTDANEDEILYQKAVKIVIESNRASISYVQRQLRIGYNRAAILIEKMQEDGILTPPDPQGRRSIIKK